MFHCKSAASFGFIGTFALCFSLFHCSLVVERSASQCTNDGDCKALGAGFENAICSAEKVCVTKGTNCNTNADCIAQLGVPAICRTQAGTKTCVQITNEDCKTVAGSVEKEDTVLLGSMYSTTGDVASSQLALQHATELAIQEWQNQAIQIGSKKLNLALLKCNDSEDPLRVAKHLANTVKVPMILTGGKSPGIMALAEQVTIPAGTLLMSNTVGASSLSTLKDNNLVWRTAPTDAFIGLSIAKLVPKLEEQIRKEMSLPPTEQISLTLVYKNDGYGKALRDAIVPNLVFNNQTATSQTDPSKYRERSFDNSNDSPGTPVDLIRTNMINNPSHITLLLGEKEMLTLFVSPIEIQYTQNPTAFPVRQRYLLPSSMYVNDLITLVGNKNNDLRKRMFGVIPSTSSTQFEAFRQRFEGAAFTAGTSPAAFGAAGAYDSVYLAAYSILAAQTPMVTGTSLADGFKKLIASSAQAIDVGPQAMNSVISSLQSGSTVNLQGASGALDFDAATGDTATDMSMWCLVFDGPGVLSRYQTSGLLYSTSNSNVIGPTTWATTCKLN